MKRKSEGIYPSLNPNLKSLAEIGDMMIASFLTFTPEQQADVRKAISEQILGPAAARPN